MGLTISMMLLGVCFNSIQADTIKLSNGKTIEARIVEETDDYIRVMDGAGFISKYPRLEIEAINPVEEIHSFTGSEEPVSFPNTTEQQTDKAQAAVDKVRSQLKEDLKQTEKMVQETLQRLYALPEYQATFGDNNENDDAVNKRASDKLQKERDRKYRKYKKYY